MARRGRLILQDKNAILEAWCIGFWRALAGGASWETVETVTNHRAHKSEVGAPPVDPLLISCRVEGPP